MGVTPFFGVALWARCNCDVRIGNLWCWKACFNCCYFATDHLHAIKMLILYHPHFQLSSLCKWPILMQWKCSLSIAITLQLTVSMQLKCSFSISVIFNCCHFATDHPHAVKTLVVCLFFQMMKFKSYLSSYHLNAKILKLKKWSGHGEMIDPWEDLYTQKDLLPGRVTI